MDELKVLIDYLRAVYAEVNADAKAEINLRKIRVEEIEINGAIYKSILAYRRLLITHDARITLNSPVSITARVKTKNSIGYKIQNYKTERHGYGKVPVNKCLNDLYGIRVILDTPITLEDVIPFCDDKLRCTNSSKGEYKAIHLYFKEDNHTFPWELQIWNRCDAESNFASHKKYKQGYTAWEKSIKEGEITDD